MKHAEHEEHVIVEALVQLHSAVKHFQVAQSKIITVLRPTHDRRLVSEAAQFADAGADELRAVREALESLETRAKAA